MAVCLGYRWPLYGSICPQVHCKHLPWHLHQDHVKQIIIPTSDDLVFVAASIHRVLYLVSLCGSILWILRPFEWHSCMKGGVFPSQTGRPRLIVISGNDGMSITIPVLDGYNQDDGSNVGIDIDIDREAGLLIVGSEGCALKGLQGWSSTGIACQKQPTFGDNSRVRPV